MRLWHKDLIRALPQKQLVAQWRELSAIVGAIEKNGTPNHLLVNKVMDFSTRHLYFYAWLIKDEMEERGYKPSDKVFYKITNYCFGANPIQDIEYKDVYFNWHDEEYFEICYYNLKEKYMCGGISEDEWVRIEEAWEWFVDDCDPYSDY